MHLNKFRMILTLSQHCHRTLDLPIHREFYSYVMIQLLQWHLMNELKNVFFRSGSIIQNPPGFPNQEFTLTLKLYMPRRVLSIVTDSFFVHDHKDQAKVVKIMSSVINV